MSHVDQHEQGVGAHARVGEQHDGELGGDHALDLYSEAADNDPLVRARALMQRITTAKHLQRERMDEGDEYQDYIDGLGVSAELDEEDEWHRTDYPLHFLFISAIIPTLISRWPRWQQNTADGAKADENFLGRANVNQELLKKIWDDYNAQQKLRMTATEAVPYAISGWSLGYDTERGLPSIRLVPAKNIILDPDGGPLPSSWRFIAERQELPLEEAMRLWPNEEVWDSIITPHPFSDENSTPIVAPPEPQEVDGVMTKTPRKVKILTVWFRGDVPAVADTTDKAPASKNRLIVMTEEETPRVLSEGPWPFILDHDAFPIEVLTFTHDMNRAHPASILRPGHSLAVQASWNLTYLNTAMRWAAARKVFINTAYLSEDQLRQIEHTTDMEIVEVEGAEAMNAMRVYSLLGDGSQAAQLLSNMQTNADVYKDVTGLNEIIRESKSHTTAVDVSLQEQRSQQRLGVLITQVEQFVTDVARKLLQIALQFMTVEDLENHLDEKMLRIEVVQDPDTGKPVKTSPFWPQDPSNEEIRREKGMRLEPDSIRHVSKDQRVQELAMLMDRIVGAFGTMQNMVKDSARQLNPLEAVKTVFGLMRRMIEETGIQNIDEFWPDDLEKLIEPVPGLPGALPPDAAAGGAPQEGAAPPAPVLEAPPGVGVEGPITGAGNAGGELPPATQDQRQALGL